MTEPFLILHKVRGEAAFDVATKVDCPKCIEAGEFFQRPDCAMCEGEGFWWIIPTSGHRAYPYWHLPLGAMLHDNEHAELVRTVDDIPALPSPWPDHYPTKATKESSSFVGNLLEAIGLGQKIDRRF